MDSIIFFVLISSAVICLCAHFDKMANKFALFFVFAALIYAAIFHNEIEQQFIKVAQYKFQSAVSQGFE